MYTEDSSWITRTAEELVRSIFKQMAGIQVRRLAEKQEGEEITLDGVAVHIRGDERMEVQLLAQPGMFRRLTKNISGEEPIDEAEIEEYATEFFNVLCGRFISEICNKDHMLMRFNPPVYQKSAHLSDMEELGECTSLRFRTDEEELVEFSWEMPNSEAAATA